MRIENNIKLHLNEEEANWLKAIMQNPLFGETLGTEEHKEREMRRSFWITKNGSE